MCDGEMSNIRGGKLYIATKQQMKDAEKLLKAIMNNDKQLAVTVWKKYSKKSLMHKADHVYNELSSKGQKVVELLSA